MSLYTKKRLFCPGPTPVPPEVSARAMLPASYHRSSSFKELFNSCRERLAPFFNASTNPLILTSSGTGAMEAAVVNLTNSFDRVVTVNAGKFGDRWGKIAASHECHVSVLDVELGSYPEPETLSKLVEDQSAKVVFFQANETSTGVQFPVEDLAKAVQSKSPDTLVVVDAISYLGAHPMKMEEWGIDAVVSGSQKGFGLPPGLSFIALSDRAWARVTSRPKFYFDLVKESLGQDQGTSAWTPASSLVEGLDVALSMMHEIGIDNFIKQHEYYGNAVRASIQAIGLDLLAPKGASNALTAFKVPQNVDGLALLDTLREKFGATFAGGQDSLKGKIIRFAHLGFVDPQDVIGGLSVLEYALKHHGHKFEVGKGVQTFASTFYQSAENIL